MQINNYYKIEMSDEAKPVRIAFNVTSARIQHYDDVIEYLTAAAARSFMLAHRRDPSHSELAAFKRRLVILAVIRRDLQAASALQIKPREILNE